jgi:hypothetical protein
MSRNHRTQEALREYFSWLSGSSTVEEAAYVVGERRSRRSPLLLVVLAVVGVVGVGVGLLGRSDGRDSRAADALTLDDLGDCSEDSPSDRPDAVGFLLETERWLEVVLSDATLAGANAASRHDTRPVAMEVREIGPDGRVAGPKVVDVLLHGSLLHAVDWAATHDDARVFLGLSGAGLNGQALFALVESGDGQMAFAGDCQEEILTAPLRDRFGDQFEGVMRAALGKTGAELSRVLSP